MKKHYKVLRESFTALIVVLILAALMTAGWFLSEGFIKATFLMKRDFVCQRVQQVDQGGELIRIIDPRPFYVCEY